MGSINYRQAAQEHLSDLQESAHTLVDAYSKKLSGDAASDHFKEKVKQAISHHTDDALAKVDRIFQDQSLSAAAKNKAFAKTKKELLQQHARDLASYHERMAVYRTEGQLLMGTAGVGAVRKVVPLLVRHRSLNKLLQLVDQFADLLPLDKASPRRGLGWLNQLRHIGRAYREAMVIIERQPSLTTAQPKVRADVQKSYQADPGAALKRRKGVVVLGDGTLAVALPPHARAVAQQLASLHFQKARRRNVIDKQFAILMNDTAATLDNRLVPFNQAFDAAYQVQPPFMGAIAGDEGISSGNREVEHLINGYVDRLTMTLQQPAGDGATAQATTRTITALRHAITSYKFEKDPVERQRVATQMAGELLKAAVLVSIHDRGLSLQDLAQQQRDGQRGPWRQLFASMSLVTPDLLRQLKAKGASEAAMWRDQRDALHGFDTGKPIELDFDGVQLLAQFDIIPTNFGVNPLSMLGVGPLGPGAWTQWSDNKRAVRKLGVILNTMTQSLDPATASRLTLQRRDRAQALVGELQRMLRHPRSYITNGHNQYEASAKIAMLVDEIKELNEALRGADGQAPYDGLMAAFNCMSGKDRTGIVLAVYKTLSLMNAANGWIPSHKELEHDQAIQDQFVETYIAMLRQYGGLEITQINTGVPGYKSDPLLYPDSPVWQRPENADILAFLAGFSSATKK